jgi:prevent-host-death family protein
MTRVTIQEAQSRLVDLMNAAAGGEEVIIASDGATAVRLVPVVHPKRPRQAGSAKGLITMSDDFDEPLDDFKEYMP